MIGRRLKHFRITERLASGGMGVVYRARDEHLDRDVAVKILPEDALQDEHARQRMRREALALSRLKHPHINVVHDFDRSEGTVFMVMELVEGETVEHALQRGPPPEAEVRRIGIQIASALAAAHAQGIVHRDLKPGNVMLTTTGDVKVLDFGIAKRLYADSNVTTAPLTDAHALVGTLPYMAPEQLLAQPVDGRTDVFALGAMLYEMATGRRPFDGPNAMVISNAILSLNPPAPRTIRPEISESLERGILRCLAKSPGERFASARELGDALTDDPRMVPAAPPGDAVVAPVAVGAMGDGTRKSRRIRSGASARSRRAYAVVLTALVIVSLGSILLGRMWQRGGDGPTYHALAVLPFDNLSADPEQTYFADGMAEELITKLSSIRALRVTSRSSSMTYRNSGKPLPRIAQELDVDVVVTGSVQRSANRVRVRAQLVHAPSDRMLWADSFDSDLGDVLGLQSQLAQTIAERIGVEIQPQEKQRLVAPRRVNPEAYEHYLRGRYYWHQFTPDDWQRALHEFQRATAIDPAYPEAFAGISDTYALMSSNVIPSAEALPRARAAAERALALQPDLPAALASLGYVQFAFDHDWASAEASFRKALEINPHEPTALQNYGYLLHTRGRFDEALSHFQRAREVDPLSPYVATMALWPLNHGRRYAEAIAGARKVLAADSSTWYPHLIIAQSLAFSGRLPEAIPEFEMIAARVRIPMLLAWLGWAHGRAGHRHQAEAILTELTETSKTRVVQSYAMALVHIGLGRNGEALRWLEHGVDERSDEMMFVNVDPVWDPIRSDPRFEKILRRLGFVPG